MGVVTGGRSEKGKGQQQPEEREDCAFDRSALRQGLMRDAKTAAKLDENEHDRQHEEGAVGLEVMAVEPR
jgi:hypothetical protein